MAYIEVRAYSMQHGPQRSATPAQSDHAGRSVPAPPVHVEQALQYVCDRTARGSIDVTGVVVTKTHMIDGGFILAQLADSRYPSLKVHFLFVGTPIFWGDVRMVVDTCWPFILNTGHLTYLLRS